MKKPHLVHLEHGVLDPSSFSSKNDYNIPTRSEARCEGKGATPKTLAASVGGLNKIVLLRAINALRGIVENVIKSQGERGLSAMLCRQEQYWNS